MDYIYHCQPQAEEFARQIIPVPMDYPLQDGLSEDFRTHFVKLCELAKEMYLDMANQPQAYGLKLIDINSEDIKSIRVAKNTIHRLVDILFRLCQCGKVEKHQLIVSAELFRKAVKESQGAVSNPIPKYELILSRLIDFGFVISDFTGKPFGKTVESFIIEYPDIPHMIDTIKIYCDCWVKLKNDHSNVLIWKEFHHNFYRFDYKVTAAHDKLNVQQWLHDKALRFGYPAEIDEFYIAFYEYSLKYKGLHFDGNYNYKSKRIARDLQFGLGEYTLSLILKDMDNYMTELEAMPNSVKKPFSQSSCNHCDFQGATDEYCKFRRNWTLNGTAYDACAFYGFHFNDFDLARIPDYWRLLELEYKLKKKSIC